MLTRQAITAMLLMTFGVAALVAMDAAVKVLVVEDIHAVQLLALRSVIIVPAIYLAFRVRGEQSRLKPGRWGWQVARAVIGFIAPCSFFMALVFLPQADATVVFFAAPLLITVSSVIFLSERFGPHRWVAVVVGFIGVAIALNPEGGMDWRGYVLALVGTIAYAAFFIMGRHLAQTESTPSLVMSFNVGVGIIGLLLLPFFWQPMDSRQWMVLCLLALLAVTGHFCFQAAFARAQASLLSPFDYTALLWAVMYDWLLWQMAPNGQTMLGGSIIVVAGLYFVYRERLYAANQQ